MNALQRIAGGAATAFAVFALAAPAYADGMRGSIKDKPAETRRCTFSANAALTSDYVFRGFSQSSENVAIQGGFDATCGMFYAGVWASSIDFGHSENLSANNAAATIELDAYAGIKFNTGRLAWDAGVITYNYPNHASETHFGGFRNPNYIELKLGVSTEVWKGGTLGGTVYFSPDYAWETGNVWTVEGTFSQTLPTIMGRITPTFSALIGYNKGEDNDYKSFGVANGDDHYVYWNAGVTFALDKNWSIDVRYWDTNIANNGAVSHFCDGKGTAVGNIFQCDERVVGTLKFTY
jgi:uncharacterized protein (TIGR02001 family)